MIRQLSAIVLLAIAAGCTPAANDGAAGDSHGVSTDPNAATGFITATQGPPAGVGIKEDGTIASDADGRPYTYALLGKPLPELSGMMADGTPFDPASLDKWTVIDVWGIWCGDCMADAPYVAALVRAIDQDPDLDFLSIHVPASAKRASDKEMFGKYGSVARYFAAKGYSYPTLVDPDASIREALKISWTPSYLLVDPDGIVRGFRTDLSVAGGEPVKDFLRDVARVKTELRKAGLDTPVKHASIGPQGAAGLTGPIPFNTNAIRAAFPGYEVVPGQVSAEGDTHPVFNIMASGTTDPAYVVESGWSLGQVYRVSTANPDIAGPLGERVGTYRLSELPGALRAGCLDGAGPSAGLLICTERQDNARFERAFRPDASGTDATLVSMAYLPDMEHVGD